MADGLQPHPRSRYLLLRSYLRRRKDKEDRVENRWHKSSLVRNQVSLLAQLKRENPSIFTASRSRLGIAFAGWTSARRRDPAIPEMPRRDFLGTVTPIADALQPGTRMLLIEIDPNPDHA